MCQLLTVGNHLYIFYLRYKCVSEHVFFENRQADISIEGLSTLDIIMNSFIVPFIGPKNLVKT